MSCRLNNLDGGPTAEEIARFERLLYYDPNTGCHIFYGLWDRKGYGSFYLRRRSPRAHRAAWLLAGRSIPADLCVLHNCPFGDMRACCNVDHLWLGTSPENTWDMARKGRGPRSAVGLPSCVSQKSANCFQARVYIRRKLHRLGYFKTPEAAHAEVVRFKREAYQDLRPTDRTAVAQ